MINLTPVASTKVKEIMSMQSPVPVALRVAVVGGGCSGFQYHMAFENQTSDADQVFEGFKFNNPNVKSTCGCGSSFSV